ncbi:ketopantoate reductase family protein [Acinetobacter sp. WZC-1]|uniref:ketopantoate reductase family protein n=1 Tax=Acinetobacter sp. WZC-1 TaxID=3459034 RepID=UPI00403D564F
MKILIVGAGAVGQVYGWHLKQAGHNVTFFVKDKYITQLYQGLTLHRLGFLGNKTQHWSKIQAISELGEVANGQWDQIWLTLSSDALREELAAQVMALADAATVVCLQPDMEDGDYVKAHVANETQVVQGLITFISYQSPLPNQTGPEGIAYFLTPISPGLFAGDKTRVRDVVKALNSGGISARIIPDFAKSAARAPALMQPLIAALEANAWQLSTFSRGPYLRLGLKAASEALSVVHHETGANIKSFKWLHKTTLWRIILPLSQLLLPLPLEAYLHFHFSKVGEQTRFMLNTYIRLGKKHQLNVEALEKLQSLLTTD